MKTIEQRLEAAAHEVRHKVTLVTPRSSRSVTRKVGRTKVGQLVGAAAAVFALLIAGSFALRGGGSQPASGTAGIPPLFIDVGRIDNDLTLSYLDNQVVSEDLPDNLTRLRSYGAAAAGLADARLWVLTYPEGSDFFRGEAFNDPGWEPLDVPAGEGYITTEVLSTTVMWNPPGDPDGPALRIQGYGVDAEAVIAAVDSMEYNNDEWTPGTLPNGFVELYVGYDYLAPGERSVAFIWAGTAGDNGGEITLWLYQGMDDTIAERNLLGFLPYGPASEVTANHVEIRGHDGVEYLLPDGVVYQWMETPEAFARLLIQGPVDPQQALAALVEIDPITWNDTIESWKPQPADFDPTVTTVSPTTTMPG